MLLDQVQNDARDDVVFLDIRGGGKALGLCSRTLPETEQPVALLLGGSPDLMALLRLGSGAHSRAREGAGQPAPE